MLELFCATLYGRQPEKEGADAPAFLLVKAKQVP